MATWRLIIDGPGPGAWNMAVDRAIVEAHADGEAPSTLRLYGWDRPTVSLGAFQDVEDVDRSLCAERGIGLCRRPTGGRGVLHDDELTYAVVAGLADGLPRGVSASYRMLCGALVQAYRELGVSAALTARERGIGSTGACYLHATAADLSLGAAKLSGSAQVWRRRSCLQHGSFVITRDVEREARVFRLRPEERDALARTTITIADAAGTRPQPDGLAGAVCAGFQRALCVSLEPGCLSAGELERARALVAEHEVP